PAVYGAVLRGSILDGTWSHRRRVRSRRLRRRARTPPRANPSSTALQIFSAARDFEPSNGSVPPFLSKMRIDVLPRSTFATSFATTRSRPTSFIRASARDFSSDALTPASALNPTSTFAPLRRAGRTFGVGERSRVIAPPRDGILPFVFFVVKSLIAAGTTQMSASRDPARERRSSVVSNAFVGTYFGATVWCRPSHSS